MKTFPSNVDQAKGQGFSPLHEDIGSFNKSYQVFNVMFIGEAGPINSDGTCIHPYLFPNSNKTKCILPQRIDIGEHYITTGAFPS